jgi:hypothetical protein
MQRQTLENERAQTRTFELDISHLGAGAYFLRWQCGAEKSTSRFIKLPN